MDTREVTRQIRIGNMAVITGGEPMLWDLEELLANLAFLGVYTQIETNGTLKPLYISEPNWLTVSPKPVCPIASDKVLPAQLAFRQPWEVNEYYYTYANEFKWVVDGDLSFDCVEAAWRRCRRKRPPVFSLMPEGCPPKPEFVHLALVWLEKHPAWRYSDRLQWRIGVK
jgi:organic radical activating enzyme